MGIHTPRVSAAMCWVWAGGGQPGPGGRAMGCPGEKNHWRGPWGGPQAWAGAFIGAEGSFVAAEQLRPATGGGKNAGQTGPGFSFRQRRDLLGFDAIGPLRGARGPTKFCAGFFGRQFRRKNEFMGTLLGRFSFDALLVGEGAGWFCRGRSQRVRDHPHGGPLSQGRTWGLVVNCVAHGAGFGKKGRKMRPPTAQTRGLGSGGRVSTKGPP